MIFKYKSSKVQHYLAIFYLFLRKESNDKIAYFYPSFLFTVTYFL